MNYKILTDSSSGLPKNIIDRFDITVLPLSVIVNGNVEEVKCDDEVFMKNFYQRLREKENVSTSAINEQEFYERFKCELEKGFDIIYIGLSSGLSITIDNANKASKKLKEEFVNNKVYVVDSLNACLGEGLLTYYACLKKEEGYTIDEVYKYLTDITLNINSNFTVKTLSYLAKGGRISKLSYALGTVADVKPVMHVNEKGKLIALSKVIGRKRSMIAIAEAFLKTVIHPESQTVFIGHGDCIEDAELLAKMILRKTPVKEFVFNYIDPIIATHSGPDTLAVFALGTSRQPFKSEQALKSDLSNNSAY